MTDNEWIKVKQKENLNTSENNNKIILICIISLFILCIVLNIINSHYNYKRSENIIRTGDTRGPR